MEPQLVDFSVIKQKIIKTDEILQMYLETEKKLKKAQVMNKNLKVQATTSLNRLKLENERYTFTIESSKTKCDDLQSENQQLMEQKSSLEKKYSSLLVDSQSTILELQNELKMIKDLNASAEKLSVSPKRKTMHEKNSPKKFKELELKLQKVEENEKKLKEHNDILLIDRKQVADEITRIKIEHSKVIASLNMEKSKLERDIKQLCSQIDSEKRQHTIIRDKDHEISKLKAEVLALRELKEQIKHLQEQNKKLNSDILYKDVALYKAKEKMQEIQNVHTLHAETQTAPEPKVEPSKCNCIKNESLCKDKLMVCSITQTEPTTEDSDSNSHKAKDKILAIHNVHTEHAETQTDPKPEDKPPKCSCIKKQPLCMNKIMVSSNTQTEPLTGYSDSNMHKAKEKILAIQKGHIVHAETQTSSDPQMLPPKCSCFNKEPLCAKKITTCSFTQTDPLTADPVSKFKALNKDDVVDNIFKEMIFLPRMLSPMRNLSQDELIIDRFPKFLPSIPEIMITPSTPLEKNMPLFADIPANMESSDTIPRVETANQKIVNVPLAGKKLSTGIFECDISKRGREVLQHKNDDIKVLDLRKCEENLVLKEINMENPSEPKCDNGLIKNGDEKNLVPEGIVSEVKTSNHECENELIQNRDDRIDTSDLNTSRKDIVPEEDVTEHFKYNSIQNGDDENLVPKEVITEPKTSKNDCEKESTQNRYDGINTLHLNTNQNNIVSQEIVTELKTSEECDNWSIQTRDNGIDTPDLNTSENNSVPEEVSAELKNHEYNNKLSSERIEDVEQAKPTEKPLRKKKLGPSTRNSTFIKKQIAMKHANKKGLFKKRFMSRKLKTQDSVLRALQVLKQSKINFTISNESTLPLLLHEHDWLNKHCHTSTNFVPPPATKVPSTSKDKQSVERLRCSSSCCNKMFMLLSGKSRNPNLHGFFKVKKEQESPLYSRMDTTTDDQPGNPLKWLNESLKKEITPENLLDTLAELVSQKLRDNKSTKRKRSSPSENSEFFSETETEIERLFPNPKNTLERNKMLLKKAKYDLDMESTSVTSLEENDIKNVSSQTEEKSDSSLSKQLSQEQTVQELQMNEPSMPLVKIPVPDPRTPEKRNQTIEDADSCDSFGFTIHPDLLSPLSTSTVTESPKPKIVLATEFPSSIKNTADPKEIKRKIEFESSSCSEKKEFSSLLSPTNNESILGNEICSIGYTNSFSVVRNIQSHNTEIRNETATNNDVYHHTSKEKDDTHQNKLGNYVEGIFKLENTNICLLETKTNMSDDKPNSEVVDCKKYMLDPSSSFESSSDGGNIKNKQIKQSSINNVEVTPNSNTCINTSEKNISEDKLHYEVVDCEKNISDQSSSDVGNIENEQQTEASSVNNGEVTPNSDTCIKKSEIQSSGDKLTYDLVDCKKNISDLSGSIKSSFDMGEMENEQERSLWQRSQNVRSDQLSRIKMRPSLPTVNEIKKQEDWKEPHPKTSIIRRDVGRQDTSESDNQLDGPQSPKLSDDKFSVNDYIKPIPLEKDEYVSKKNEEDSPVTKKNEEDTLLSLRKGSKSDPKEIKRKIEFESSSCSEKKEFSSLLSPTNNESILGNEICSIGYTNSFSVVRNTQSENAEIRNETATNNDVYHHTSKEKDDTHQNKLGNYVEGIFKLENTNICLLETKTNMSDDKPNSEVVDCKKNMLDPSSSFESSSDGGNIKNEQIKQSLINNVEVTPISNTYINTSEKNISEDKLHYEVVDCEKNISDQSSSDVGNIENEQQTEASSVNNGEGTPNSDTCIQKSEIQSSGDKLTYDLVDCKKNISDLSGSIKSLFDMGEMENEQERSLVANIEITPNSDKCISKFLKNESEMSEEVGKFINNFDLNISFRDTNSPLKRPVLPNIGRELFVIQGISPMEEKSTKITTDIIGLLASSSNSEILPDCTELPANIGYPNIKSYKQETYMSLGMEFSEEDDDYEDNELSNVRYSPEHNRDEEIAREIECNGRKLDELHCPESPKLSDDKFSLNDYIKPIPLEKENEEDSPVTKKNEEDTLLSLRKGSKSDPKEIKRKIEFKSSSCSEKKEFSSLLSPTNNESILGNEICYIGYTNSFSVVRNTQSHNAEIRNETATNNDVYHHTSKEKDDTHQNKLGNYVEGIFKLENTNICLLETKTNMSDDKPNSEVVDCKKNMLDPSSSFESSSDGRNIKNEQIKQSLINNVEVTPISNTYINTSEKNISEDKLHYEVVDCEKNISDQSSSDVGNIENEQQTEASSVNNGEGTPNSDTCIQKSEIQSSGDKLTYDLVDCKKNISDLSGSIKSSFDMGEKENEQERSLWQRSQNVKSDQLSRIKMRPSLPTVNEIKKQEDWKEPHPKTSIIRRDVGRQDTSESDNQLDGPQSPKLSDDQFSVNNDIKPIPLEKDEYVSKKNEEDSPVTKKNEEDTLLSLRKGSKSDLSMVSHKKIYGLTTSDKAIQTFHPEEHTVGDCKRVNSPQSEISEPVKRKRGRPRKQKIETDHTAEFDVEQSNSNLQTVIQGKLELRNQAPKTLGTSKKIEAMKRRRTSKRLGGSLANSDEQGSTENVKNGTVIPEALYPRTKRLREGRQALSKEFIDSEGSESEYDAQNRTKKNCTETKISNGLLPNGNTAVTCTDESGITQRLPSISPKKTPSKKPKNKPMTKMKSNILRQMNIKRKMFRTDVPLSTARSIESNCDVKTKATDRFNVEIKDNSNKIRANMDVPKEPPPTKKKINVMQNFLIPPGDSNPVDLLKSDSPPNLIPEPSSSQDSLGLTETEATRTTRKPNRKGQPSNNSCDILSQIIGQMDKNRPAITVKPKLVNKEFPDGTQEKQWRSGVMDIAEIVHNKDARMEDPYGRLNFHVDGTGLLKKGAELTVRMKVMVKKLMNIPDEDDIPRAIILEFKRLKLEETIDIIIHEVAKDFRDKPIDKYYPAPLMTRTQRLYLNLLVSLENEVKDNVLDKFLSRTQQYIFKTGSRLKATVPLTRLFLSICRLKADINRMRTFCCEAFFYVGNLAVPILFTVLTSWIEVIPMAADVENYPIANVLVQLVHLKNFFLHGYNLIPLRCLLHQYHGYPKERRNCDELFEEVFHQYLRNPTPTSNFAIRLYCRNKENKWVYKKINEFFKPLIYKIPMENVNFKATVILMLGKISKQFKPKDEHDAVCLVELNRFFQDLLEDGMPDLVRQSVFWSIEGLPKKKPENPAQKSEGDSAGHSENPT